MTTLPRALADWPIGRPARLLGTGHPDGVARRLAQLGLREGSTLTPLQRTAGRGLVVASGELRIALDRASAAALVVGDVRPHLDPAAPPEGGDA